jgi:hypothetical protein
MADVLRTFVELELDSTVDILHACSAKRVLSISPYSNYSIIRLRRADTFTPRFGNLVVGLVPKRKDGEVPD